ncbi:hypothetical protein AVEN_184798-1 [Araneus ventricosus]|uniref:Uncharacterized protein n=1 Tax=Araneus ventricosus TaxID=182803 RepID=A0A4Y2JAE7_ARAVE|nr:hypothetical protein AVEN_184798-1 [Araneus ventricosus]
MYQQCLTDNMIVHSTQKIQGNGMIAEDLHETYDVQEGLPRNGDLEQSRIIQPAYNNQDIQESMTYTGRNVFQKENHGDQLVLRTTW